MTFRCATLFLGSLLLAGCADAGPTLPVDHRIPGGGTPAAQPREEARPSGIVGSLEAEDLDESSGLAASRRHPGVFWSHNDSGGDSVLFAFDDAGAHKGRVHIGQALAEDWEDLAMDGSGAIWVHDGGNNNNRRRNLTVYRVPEPETLHGVTLADRAVRFRFPDQKAFPEPGRMNFDSEAIFWDGDRLFLLSKHRSDTRTKLYRFPAGIQDDPTWDAKAMLVPGKKPDPVVLELLGDFEIGGNPKNHGGKVSAADLSRDGRRLAVLSYNAIFVFERPDGTANWLAGTHRRIDLEQTITMQCEAIAWDGEALLFTNEQRMVMRIANPVDPGCVRFPSEACKTR